MLKSDVIKNVLTNNHNNLSRKDSVKHTHVNSLLDSNQVNDITRSPLMENAISKNRKENEISVSSQTNQFSKHRNSCITNIQDKKNLTTSHQNICDIRTKTKEILCHFSSDLPHIMCFTEHHLSVSEIQSLCIDNYTLSTYYCTRHAPKGGVCIFINTNQISSTLNLAKYFTDTDTEVCAIQLNISNKKLYILTIQITIWQLLKLYDSFRANTTIALQSQNRLNHMWG
jgi:hypothetical protein